MYSLGWKIHYSVQTQKLVNPALKSLVRGDQAVGEENREVQVGGGGDKGGRDEVGGEGVGDEVGVNKVRRYLKRFKKITAVYASFTLHEHITLHYVTNRLFRLQCNVGSVTQNKPLHNYNNQWSKVGTK